MIAELNGAPGQQVWVEAAGEADWHDRVLLVPSGPQSTPSSGGSYPSQEMTFPESAPSQKMLCQGSAPGQGTQMCNQPFSSSSGPNPWLPGALILLCALGVLTVTAAAVSARRRTV